MENKAALGLLVIGAIAGICMGRAVATPPDPKGNDVHYVDREVTVYKDRVDTQYVTPDACVNLSQVVTDYHALVQRYDSEVMHYARLLPDRMAGVPYFTDQGQRMVAINEIKTDIISMDKSGIDILVQMQDKKRVITALNKECKAR